MILPTTRNTAYRLDDVLGDGHAGLELDREGPPRGGAPGVEPPPSEVAATLTELGFVASHPLLVLLYSYLNWITEITPPP